MGCLDHERVYCVRNVHSGCDLQHVCIEVKERALQILYTPRFSWKHYNWSNQDKSFAYSPLTHIPNFSFLSTIGTSFQCQIKNKNLFYLFLLVCSVDGCVSKNTLLLHKRSHALLKSLQLTGATAAVSEGRGECTIPYSEEFSLPIFWCWLVELHGYHAECIHAFLAAARARKSAR